jgi:hypothetical protein
VEGTVSHCDAPAVHRSVRIRHTPQRRRVARLLALPTRPQLVALSGSGGAHGYSRIEQTLAAEWIERANVRLIHHLGDGADYASFDCNRFMRVPGSRNLKSGRYCQIVHADLSSRAYDVRDVVGGLPDPPADDPRAPSGSAAHRLRRRSAGPLSAIRSTAGRRASTSPRCAGSRNTAARRRTTATSGARLLSGERESGVHQRFATTRGTSASTRSAPAPEFRARFAPRGFRLGRQRRRAPRGRPRR